jgi:thymidylate synthase
MVPDQLIGSLGDTHLYSDHIELVKEQIDREPFELPTLKIEKTDEFWNGFDVSMFGHLDVNDFTIENYVHHPSIKMPLSN